VRLVTIYSRSLSVDLDIDLSDLLGVFSVDMELAECDEFVGLFK